LMQGGKFLSVGTPKEITGSFKEPILTVKARNMYKLLNDLNKFDKIKDAYSFGEYHHAVMKNGIDENELKNYLEQKDNKEIEIKKTSPNIEDCFLQLMKK
jgi:ABC-2 type transport system ATP-binding protein